MTTHTGTNEIQLEAMHTERVGQRLALRVTPPPLEIATLLLTLRLDSPVTLPVWKGQLVSLLRGRLGPLLLRRECAADCAPLEGRCVRGGICTFLSVFAPVSPDPTQSPEPGAKEPPRPYAFLPPSTKGRNMPAAKLSPCA